MVNRCSWEHGIYAPLECHDINVFYTLLGSDFPKRSPSETVGDFTDLILAVRYPLDLLRVISEHPLYTLLLVTIENGTTWEDIPCGIDGHFYKPIGEVRKRPDCQPMFRYPAPIGKFYNETCYRTS